MNKTFINISGIVIIGLSLTLQSCTIAKISGKGPIPMLLNQPSEDMELVEHVTVKKNINFDFTNSFDVSLIMAPIISAKKPDAIINTSITIKSSIDNFLINLVTLGIANSSKVIIDADFMENSDPDKPKKTKKFKKKTN